VHSRGLGTNARPNLIGSIIVCAMTLIIGVLTQDYALLASDRRLTMWGGPQHGSIVKDDEEKEREECKLVNVCNTRGIGYAGLAEVEGLPIHEWIAKTLASENYPDFGEEGEILKKHANRVFGKVSIKMPPQQFLIVGWGYLKELTGLHPYMQLISNAHDESGKKRAQPANSFLDFVQAPRDGQPFVWATVGRPIDQQRIEQLDKNLGLLVNREITPKAALRLLVDEIVYKSSRDDKVGSKILGFCIPKNSVLRQLETGMSFMTAEQPYTDGATFTYFEPGFNELKQYGPTCVCGECAYTTETGHDTSSGSQYSQVTLLSVPKEKP